MKFLQDRQTAFIDVENPLKVRVVDAPDHPNRAHVEVYVDPEWTDLRGPRTDKQTALEVATKLEAGEDITLADYGISGEAPAEPTEPRQPAADEPGEDDGGAGDAVGPAGEKEGAAA